MMKMRLIKVAVRFLSLKTRIF